MVAFPAKGRIPIRLGLSTLLFAAALNAAPASENAIMFTGGLTSQPIGHYEFCKATPAECMIRPRDRGPAPATDNLFVLARTVNKTVNDAVRPMNDIDVYGKDEVWTYPTAGVGDCEDYVLEKRRRLSERGVSLSNLLVTVVRKPDGEGHAVLTLRTMKGDYILDNLRDDVRLWTETGYRFLKRQASNHTGRWVSLREDNNMLVGAVED